MVLSCEPFCIDITHFPGALSTLGGHVIVFVAMSLARINRVHTSSIVAGAPHYSILGCLNNMLLGFGGSHEALLTFKLGVESARIELGQLWSELVGVGAVFAPCVLSRSVGVRRWFIDRRACKEGPSAPPGLMCVAINIFHTFAAKSQTTLRAADAARRSESHSVCSI